MQAWLAAYLSNVSAHAPEGGCCCCCRAGVPIEDVLVRFKNLSVTGLAAVKQPRSTGHKVLGALQVSILNKDRRWQVER